LGLAGEKGFISELAAENSYWVLPEKKVLLAN